MNGKGKQPNATSPHFGGICHTEKILWSGKCESNFHIVFVLKTFAQPEQHCSSGKSHENNFWPGCFLWWPINHFCIASPCFSLSQISLFQIAFNCLSPDRSRAVVQINIFSVKVFTKGEKSWKRFSPGETTRIGPSRFIRKRKKCENPSNQWVADWAGRLTLGRSMWFPQHLELTRNSDYPYSD